MRTTVKIVIKALLVAIVLFAGVACSPVARPVEQAGLEPQQPSGTLTVLAAASLSDTFDALGNRFQETHPHVTITFAFAGSQQLAQQIEQGAPADVFASANQRQMDVAVETGRIASDTPAVFVQNLLVIVTPAEIDFTFESLEDLAQPGLHVVVAAPEVPVGAYTQDFLDKAAHLPTLGPDYVQAVTANIVSYEDNVRAVLNKVILGEADAGVVYTSDVALDAGQVRMIEIPMELNTIAHYPIAPLLDSPNPGLAQAFIDFVLSPTGQEILEAYGFGSADE